MQLFFFFHPLMLSGGRKVKHLFNRLHLLTKKLNTKCYKKLKLIHEISTEGKHRIAVSQRLHLMNMNDRILSLEKSVYIPRE